MKKFVFAIVSVVAVAAMAEVPFKLGMARYTLHAYSFDKALELLKELDCRQMGLVENTIPRNATDAEIAAYKEKLAKYGVEVVTAGPLYCNEEKQVAKLFEFAKRYGLKSVSVVPFDLNPKSSRQRTMRKGPRLKNRFLSVNAGWNPTACSI